MDYKKAGVDIEAGYKSVELIKAFVKETDRPEVIGGLGGFAGAFPWRSSRAWKSPHSFPERMAAEQKSSSHF